MTAKPENPPACATCRYWRQHNSSTIYGDCGFKFPGSFAVPTKNESDWCDLWATERTKP